MLSQVFLAISQLYLLSQPGFFACFRFLVYQRSKVACPLLVWPALAFKAEIAGLALMRATFSPASSSLLNWAGGAGIASNGKSSISTVLLLLWGPWGRLTVATEDRLEAGLFCVIISASGLGIWIKEPLFRLKNGRPSIWSSWLNSDRRFFFWHDAYFFGYISVPF